MQLSSVKMIVTDMDGTLLNSKSEVSDQFFELFHALKKHKVRFVAASGRQYSSMYEKLDKIQNEISIVAENGGFIKHGTQELGSILLSRDKVNSLIPPLREIDGLYTVLCGKESAYIESSDPKFTNILSEYYTHFNIVEDLHSVDYDEFFKVAVYHFGGSEKHVYPHLRHFEDQLQVKVSGAHWIDISDPKAHKGNALKILQKKFGISSSETMVFGDFNNDLEMLQEGYFSYAMANAHANVKATARFSTRSNDDNGVEHILQQVLDAKEKGLD